MKWIALRNTSECSDSFPNKPSVHNISRPKYVLDLPKILQDE